MGREQRLWRVSGGARSDSVSGQLDWVGCMYLLTLLADH